MNTATTWILVGNASQAKLYESHNIGRELRLLESFHHPESRNKGLDLVTDRDGSYQSNNGQGHGAFVASTEPKQVEIERFTKELADKLESARVANQYDRLVLIMPPHCHGMLNKACNNLVLDKVIHHIDKDYTQLKDQELIAYLDDLARY